MNTNVKKAAITILYTLSIVVALWIGRGFTQTNTIDNGSMPCNSGAPLVGNCKNFVNREECDFPYYRKSSGNTHIVAASHINVCHKSANASSPPDVSICGYVLTTDNDELGDGNSTNCE